MTVLYSHFHGEKHFNNCPSHGIVHCIFGYIELDRVINPDFFYSTFQAVGNVKFWNNTNPRKISAGIFTPTIRYYVNYLHYSMVYCISCETENVKGKLFITDV